MIEHETAMDRHTDALMAPATLEEKVIGDLMEVIHHLTSMHKDDMVLRHSVLHSCLALRELLAGERGRFDGGTVDSYVKYHMEECGFNPDTQESTRD